jgi:transposase InsO family protein
MRFSFESRCRIVELVLAGESPEAAAAACGASRATGYRLWQRYRQGGWSALADHRSTPRRQPRRLGPAAEREILAWREQTGYGPLRLAAIIERPASTIGKVLRRLGRSRLPRPARDPRVRYERASAGELLHVDTKKLGRFWRVGKRILTRGALPESRGAGWQWLRVAIDDHSRLAYAELLPAEDRHACAAFLARAVAWYAERGVTVERVLSDNAKAYHSQHWHETCERLGVARRYTRPYSPWTNGKAEALVKTLLNEWAYRFAYPSSEHRSRALSGFMRWYNRRRPHGSLGGRPPISRVSQVCGHYSWRTRGPHQGSDPTVCRQVPSGSHRRVGSDPLIGPD